MSSKIKYIRRFLRKTFELPGELLRLRQVAIHSAVEGLMKDPRYDNEKCLMRSGYKVYSQGDEDGIIDEIFNRIGVTNKLFIEFGIGDGTENNTLYLLFKGWKGLWIEASSASCSNIEAKLAKTIESGTLRLVNAFVSKDNINQLISSKVKEKEIDLLSIDIDGNDAHVFRAISCVRPRVVAIEYNAKFPPAIDYCMRYNESHMWSADDNLGASLKHLELLLKDRGYSLVGCCLLGTNAFFVRDDLVADLFMAPYTAENHYEPARYHLIGMNSGHPPSLSTLECAELP